MRKWLVRGLVFSGLGALLAVGLAYQACTNPEAVRRLVLEKLGVRFLNVTVTLESAHMRLLGGIVVQDLRMSRSDRLERSIFLYVPSAVIFPDKEHMLAGQMGVSKVELTRPELRLVRERDGSFNVKDVLGPVDLNERMPTVVIKGGTIVFEDHSLSAHAPLLELKDVDLTVVNDPLPTLIVEGTGRADVVGLVKISATVPRATLAARITLSLPEVPVGPDLIERLAGPCPELAAHLRQLRGTGRVEARLDCNPEDQRPFHYAINAKLTDGELDHARLPSPLTKLTVEAKCVDGAVPTATLSANCGPARLTVSVKDLKAPEGKSSPDLEDLVSELEAKVEHLSITPELLAKLPAELDWVQKDYAPTGLLTIEHTYKRGRDRPTKRHWSLQAEGMSAVCSHFPYPVQGARGTIEIETANAPERDFTFDLRGEAGGSPVSVSGTIRGPLATSAVQVDVRGKGLVLDDKLFTALQALGEDTVQVAAQFRPEASRRLGLRARPMGKADFHAALRRPLGEEKVHNVFTVDFREMAVKYDLFPYPLEDVSGTLVFHPDHWECRGFRGRHAGGEILVEGRSHGTPPPPPGMVADPRTAGRRADRVHLLIRGRSINLDNEFGQALAPPGQPDRQALFNAWLTLRLAGRMNFTAEVIDRPGQPQDIDVGVEIQGCTLKPTFFDYALEQVAGSVRYSHSCVYLHDFRARHGKAALGLTAGVIQLKPGGGFLAWLHNIRAQELVPDEAFLGALPEPMRKALLPLHLAGRLDVDTKLTLDAAPGQGPLKVWWDGGALLHDSSLKAGVELTGVQGQVSCHGHHDGRQMRGVTGGILLRQAGVLGQPLTNLSGRLEVWPDAPDVLRLYDFKADLFGGTLSGEGRIDVGQVMRYDVKLDALGLKLEDFGRRNLGSSAPEAQLEGPARASLHLMGEGNDLLGLKGNGRIDVYNGKIGRLPLLLDLLKAFGLRLPDRTAFEQAHVMFAVEGPQVRVGKLDLYGNAISLRGRGTVDLDGNNLNLDFTATPGRADLGIDLFHPISQQLLKIKARGKLGRGTDGASGMRLEKELVPSVTGPLRRVMEGARSP